MFKICSVNRRLAPAVLALWAVVAVAGCQTIDHCDPALDGPVPPEMEPAREKALVSLPAYRIAPPDVLEIEMLKLVPLPPYRAEIYDVLQIQVVGTLLDQPISGYYMVEGEGTVNLGPAYGSVRAVGMTIEEIEQTITADLKQVLARPDVSVQLARSAGTQPVTGQYLVGPDGSVNLRRYGLVNVAGKTVGEAKVAMQKHLSQYFDSPNVSVNVVSYNSKVYYIVTEGANLGDNVVRVPITGKETVLDAISTIGGLSQLSSKDIWIARPNPANSGCEQILPIDWDAITRGASSSTNYQIMPGDRVFIAENSTVALTNLVTILTGPFERIAGVTSLGVSTIRNFQTLGRGYNRLRNR